MAGSGQSPHMASTFGKSCQVQFAGRPAAAGVAGAAEARVHDVESAWPPDTTGVSPGKAVKARPESAVVSVIVAAMRWTPLPRRTIVFGPGRRRAATTAAAMCWSGCASEPLFESLPFTGST